MPLLVAMLPLPSLCANYYLKRRKVLPLSLSGDDAEPSIHVRTGGWYFRSCRQAPGTRCAADRSGSVRCRASRRRRPLSPPPGPLRTLRAAHPRGCNRKSHNQSNSESPIGRGEVPTPTSARSLPPVASPRAAPGACTNDRRRTGDRDARCRTSRPSLREHRRLICPDRLL